MAVRAPRSGRRSPARGEKARCAGRAGGEEGGGADNRAASAPPKRRDCSARCGQGGRRHASRKGSGAAIPGAFRLRGCAGPKDSPAFFVRKRLRRAAAQGESCELPPSRLAPHLQPSRGSVPSPPCRAPKRPAVPSLGAARPRLLLGPACSHPRPNRCSCLPGRRRPGVRPLLPPAACRA